MHPLPQRFTSVAGAVYTAAGVLGLSLTGFDHLTAPTGPELGVFQVNGLLSLAHLVAGAVCLYATGMDGDVPWTVTVLCAAAFGTLGLVGLAMVGGPGNVLAVNTADTVLHLLTAVAAVGVLVMDHNGSRSDLPREVTP